MLTLPADPCRQLGQADAARADDLAGAPRLCGHECPVVVRRIVGRGDRRRAAITSALAVRVHDGERERLLASRVGHGLSPARTRAAHHRLIGHTMGRFEVGRSAHAARSIVAFAPSSLFAQAE